MRNGQSLNFIVGVIVLSIAVFFLGGAYEEFAESTKSIESAEATVLYFESYKTTRTEYDEYDMPYEEEHVKVEACIEFTDLSGKTRTARIDGVGLLEGSEVVVYYNSDGTGSVSRTKAGAADGMLMVKLVLLGFLGLYGFCLVVYAVTQKKKDNNNRNG